jgi:hypothetical protein
MGFKQFQRWLEEHYACGQARAWVARNKYTYRQAWLNCKRPDWMLWFLGMQPRPDAWDRAWDALMSADPYGRLGHRSVSLCNAIRAAVARPELGL